jgi:hypothetical protein
MTTQTRQPHADLVNRDVTADKPNRLWLTDTEHPTVKGRCTAPPWTYSRLAVGWSIAGLGGDMGAGRSERKVAGEQERISSSARFPATGPGRVGGPRPLVPRCCCESPR